MFLYSFHISNQTSAPKMLSKPILYPSTCRLCVSFEKRFSHRLLRLQSFQRMVPSPLPTFNMWFISLCRSLAQQKLAALSLSSLRRQRFWGNLMVGLGVLESLEKRSCNKIGLFKITINCYKFVVLHFLILDGLLVSECPIAVQISCRRGLLAP